MKRVVITGIGAVTPLGNTLEDTWQGLINTCSGIGPITKFDPSGLPSRIGGELKGFRPEHYLPPKDILRLDPFTHYAAAAACMASEDAGLVPALHTPFSSGGKQEDGAESAQGVSPDNPAKLLDSAGVVIGSSRGGITGMETALEQHYKKGKPFSAYLMSSTTISMAASYVSMRFGIKGPVLGISTACASGTNAIGEAFRMIQRGDIDVALAGGAEAPLSRLAVGGYGVSGSLSKRNRKPEEASRPFDKDRDGFVIAEGAGILLLEELHHALMRGARIYAELAGYGSSSDAYHQTRPESRGEALAITRSLQDGNCAPDEVDYINAHATSTPLGDRAEADAIRMVFGQYSDGVHVGSCKSMLGHMLGAAGAVEAGITALSVSRGILVPSMNLENIAPECALNHVTSVMKKEVAVAVTNSFGFGGVNAVLVLKKFKK